MEAIINGLKINYIQYGKGKDIVLLHGWGQNISMMKPLGDLFANNYRITIIDLPGFGESDKLKEAWGVSEYTELFAKLLIKLKIDNPIIMAHSFGGRITFKYAASNKVDKLVMFGTPCIRNSKTIPTKVKVINFVKKVPLLNIVWKHYKKYFESEDFKNADPIMKGTIIKVVNEDLSQYAKKITAPTLLIWGESDTAAPISAAVELEKIMPDAGLIRMQGSHYLYLERLKEISIIINEFL